MGLEPERIAVPPRITTSGTEESVTNQTPYVGSAGAQTPPLRERSGDGGDAGGQPVQWTLNHCDFDASQHSSTDSRRVPPVYVQSHE